MMRRARILTLVLACAVAAACGSDSPTEPTPTPTPGTLTIIGQSDFMIIGAAVTLQATLTPTTSAVVAADWSTEDGRVAGIDRSGRLTALGSGTTTVRAVFEGKSASFAVRVTPNFAGTWEGRVRVTACVNPSPSVCQTYSVGSQYATRVTLVQNRAQVVGTLYAPHPAGLPTVPQLVVDATLSGEIELAGRLPMTGVLLGPTPTSPSVGVISDWRTEIDTTQPILRGSYNEVMASTSGAASISWEFLGLTRLPS
jgi:Bacterial Ig-like domain (group 2)